MNRALVFLALLTALPLRVAAETWALPRMSYGAPDLQGTWTNATLTGLERFDDVDALVLTPEQAGRIERGASDFLDSIDDVPEGELEAGGDVGGYNTCWIDPGSRLAVLNGEIRSSIIVDPDAVAGALLAAAQDR